MMAQTPEKKKVSTEQSKRPTNWAVPVVGGVLTVLAFLGIKNYIDERTLNKASGSLQTDESVRLATEIYNIISAAGYFDWFVPNNYAQLVKVTEVAKKIKNWQSVQDRYRDLFSDDITTQLNEWLMPDDYMLFLKNLSAMGSPTNSSGSGAFETVKTLKYGETVKFNAKADSSSVNTYKTAQDYPSKPYITLPVGVKTRSAIKFLASIKFRYLGSTVDTILYQVQIPGVSVPVFINSYYLSKA